MNEDQLIQTFFQRKNQDNSVDLGIGDDAAVLSVLEGYSLVTSIDTLLEGRHFPKNYSPIAIAQRSVAVSVSDLAAMGAIPKWLTISISLPDFEADWLGQFSEALHESLSHYQMSLVGGDTIKGPLSITLNVMGIVEQGKALQRNTAQIGDDIYITGTVGGAANALYQMLAGELIDDDLRKCFDKPQARVGIGRDLIDVAHACMDISDGVLLDLKRLLTASRMGAKIELTHIPLHPSLQVYKHDLQMNLMCGGDDYELLFTAAKDQRAIVESLSQQYALPIKRVGEVTAEKELQCFVKGKVVLPEQLGLKNLGYQHF